MSGEASSVLLAPLAGLYAAGLAARDLYRSLGSATPVTPPVPAIGVGNLSAGGTGKTSMVSWLTAELEREGLRVAILSRGFRRPDASRSPEIVSRGDGGPLIPWERAGDEPWLLARRHPRARVVVGRNRAASAAVAVRELGAEILVLDDAFQQRRLRCDPQILMVEASRPPWEDHLLPWGRLREPVSGARRASAAVLVRAGRTGTPAAASPAAASSDLAAAAAALPVGAWFAAARRASAVVACATGERYDTGMLAGRRAFLMSGIGDPAGFEATVRSLGAELSGHRAWPDHHRYTSSDLERVSRDARSAGADLVLTTEKDAVRVMGSSWLVEPGASVAPPIPVYYVEIALEVDVRLDIERNPSGGARAIRLVGRAA